MFSLMMHGPKTPGVYFVQEADNGAIKIGYADWPKKRLKELQVGNPRELRIIGLLLTDDHREESRMHRRFAAHRLRGEWFRPAPELVEFIDNMVARYLRDGEFANA